MNFCGPPCNARKLHGFASSTEAKSDEYSDRGSMEVVPIFLNLLQREYLVVNELDPNHSWATNNCRRIMPAGILNTVLINIIFWIFARGSLPHLVIPYNRLFAPVHQCLGAGSLSQVDHRSFIDSDARTLQSPLPSISEKSNMEIDQMNCFLNCSTQGNGRGFHGWFTKPPDSSTTLIIPGFCGPVLMVSWESLRLLLIATAFSIFFRHHCSRSFLIPMVKLSVTGLRVSSQVTPGKTDILPSNRTTENEKTHSLLGSTGLECCVVTAAGTGFFDLLTLFVRVLDLLLR